MSIVLNTKTYTFRGFNPQSISTYAETSAGVPNGFSWLTDKVEGADGTGKVKSRWKLKVPVVAATDTDCGCAGDLLREITVDVVVTSDRGSTVTERTDVADRIRDLVASPEFRASIINLIQASA